MITRILFLSLLTFSLFGQQRQTVYTVLTPIPINTIPSTPTFLIQNNIGQSFHTVTIVTKDMGGTCNPNTGFIIGFSVIGQLEASFDGTTYFAMPQKVSTFQDTSNNIQSKLFRATTAYPFVRFRFLNVGNLPSNCGIQAFYAGSLSASQLDDSFYPVLVQTNFPTTTVTTACGALANLSANVIAGSNGTSGLQGVIISNATSSAVTVSIYSTGSNAQTCSSTALVLTVGANSTFTIQPDNLGDYILPGPTINGFYAKTGSGTVSLNAYYAYQN